MKAVEAAGLLDVLKVYEHRIATAAMSKPALAPDLCGILLTVASPPRQPERDTAMLHRFSALLPDADDASNS